MDLRVLTRLAACAALVASFTAGCARSDDKEGRVVRDDPPLAFVQTNDAALPVDRAGAGSGLRADLVNRTDKAITITQIDLVADAGVRAAYLGHSTCKRGCPGAEPWTEDTPELDTKELVERSVDGTVPLTIEPNPERLSLLFRLQIEPDGVAAFQRGCRYLRALRMTLSTGRTLNVTLLDGDWVAAVQLEDPRPSGYVECDAVKRSANA